MDRRKFLKLAVSGALVAPLVKPLQLLAFEPAPQGGALTLEMLNEAFRRCASAAGGGVNYLITSTKIRNAYIEALRHDSRVDVEHGHRFYYINVAFRGIPIYDTKTFTTMASYGMRPFRAPYKVASFAVVGEPEYRGRIPIRLHRRPIALPLRTDHLYWTGDASERWVWGVRAGAS